MKRPGLLYGLLRVGLFAVIFAVLMLVRLEWWLAAPIAAVLGLCIAYVFFGRLRDAAAAEFRARREKPAVADDERVEDAEVDDTVASLDAPVGPTAEPALSGEPRVTAEPAADASERDRGGEPQPERESGDGRQA